MGGTRPSDGQITAVKPFSVIFSGVYYVLSFFLILAGISKIADFGSFYQGFLPAPHLPPPAALGLAALVPAIEISAGVAALFFGRRTSPSLLILFVYLGILTYAAIHVAVAPDKICRCISTKMSWFEKIGNSRGLTTAIKAGAFALLALVNWLHLRRHSPRGLPDLESFALQHANKQT